MLTEHPNGKRKRLMSFEFKSETFEREVALEFARCRPFNRIVRVAVAKFSLRVSEVH